MKSYPPGHEILYYAPATNLVGSQINHVCEFLWKFDDGEFKEGAVVSKIWNTLGMHKATCIVKNKESGLSAEKDITIYIDAPPSTLTVTEELLDKLFNSLNSSNVSANSDFGCTVSNGKVYISGGYWPSLSNAMYEFDPNSNVITVKATMPEILSNVSITLDDGRIFIPGGWNNASHVRTTRIFNPVTNTYFTAPNRLNGYGEANCSIKLPSGKICVTGGDPGGTGSLSHIDIYDPIANSWTTGLPTMNVGRQYHNMTLLGDGNILIYGGRDNGQSDASPTRTYQIFNPTTKSIVYTSGAVLPTRTAYSNVYTMSDGKVVVVGGVAANTDISTDALVFTDPYTASFTIHPLGVMTGGRCCVKLANRDTIVFLKCGPTTYGSELYKLEYPSMQVSYLGRVNIPRIGYGAMVESAPGQLVLVGGANTSPIETVNLLGDV